MKLNGILMRISNTNKKTFLCVDDFGVKYFRKDYADHIIDSFKNNYYISTYW